MLIFGNFSAEEGAGSYEYVEGLAIAIGVLVIVLVSAANDYGKEQQFRTLQNKVREEHKISVLRNGHLVMIPIQELLVGDICQVKYGGFLPTLWWIFPYFALLTYFYYLFIIIFWFL